MKTLLAGCVLALAIIAAAPAPAGQAAAPLLINGTVVTPDRVIANGWVVVTGTKITAVSADKPDIPGARTLVTKDYIYPGLVDLHNHPLYAIFPRWKPNRLFPNRYQWRNHPGYHKLIQTPEGNLVKTAFCDMAVFGEVRALMGGTTSVLGFFEPADVAKIDPCIAGRTRNLDWASGFHGTPLGQERAGNVLGIWPSDQKLSGDAIPNFKAGKYDLVAVHLGEGQRGDKVNKSEFAELEKLGLLTDKTAIIHGVALADAEFAKMAAAGTSLIWSPRSNFELYGDTVDLATALRRNVTVALAPDWSPTGSVNMLGEINYARRVLDRNFKGLVSPKQLFEMATVVPARIAKIDDKVGSLKPGLYADLFLVRSANKDVYDALATAKAEDVTLTMIDGVPLYGDGAHLAALGVTAIEEMIVCGADKVVNAAALPEGGMSAMADRLYAGLAKENVVLPAVMECVSSEALPKVRR